MDWPITDTQVAQYLGPMNDADRVTDATAASIAFVEARRSDLDFTTATVPNDVGLGAIVYASLLYNQRTSPTGYSQFGDGAIDVSGEPSYPRAMRLIGWRRPVVA